VPGLAKPASGDLQTNRSPVARIAVSQTGITEEGNTRFWVAKRWQFSMLSFPRKRESSISIEYFWIPDRVGNDRNVQCPPVTEGLPKKAESASNPVHENV